MTIRQISEITGCHYKTVARVGKQMFPGVMSKSRGIAIEYDHSQSQDLIFHLPKKNMVQLDQPVGANVPTTVDNTEMMMIFMKQLQEQQQQFMTLVIDRIDNKSPVSSKQLPAPVKSKRSQLRQLISKYAMDKMEGDHQGAWKDLYAEMYYRLGRNIRLCSQNARQQKLDYLESEGLLDNAIAIVNELMNQ